MKNQLKNQNGQAIFEFILFIPFLVFMYSIFYTVGTSINGSIDQQKAVRGYFYNLVKGNSNIVTSDDLKSLNGRGINHVGFFSLGWKEHGDETKQYGNCFKFSSLIKGSSDEDCDGSTRQADQSSAFVRVFTAYGVCGPTYVKDKGAANASFYQNFGVGQTIRACVLAFE